MKYIIIGTSLSGKTTLVKSLRAFNIYNVSEIDEELTKLNNGSFPKNNEKKMQLSRTVINNVLNSDNLIFFTNTDYFNLNDLKQAKVKGFKIIQINVELQELLRRNKQRVENEGYSDLSQWLPGMINYQKSIENIIDIKIDGEDKSENVLKKLVIYL